MNQLSSSLEKSINEISKYCIENAAQADEYSSFFAKMKKLLERAVLENDETCLNDLLGHISHLRVDEGPLTAKYSSSLELIVDAWQRKKKRMKKI